MKKENGEMASEALKELKKDAYKYHVIIALVAILLNPLWAFFDYYNSPHHFSDFLIFRLAVTLCTLLVYNLRNRLVSSPEIIALIPFIGISIQNAYMYSVMDVEEIQKHTFAYIALFIGAGMFVMWKNTYSIAVVSLSIVANFLFFQLNSNLSASEILTNGGMLTLSVALFTIVLIHTRKKLTLKTIMATLALLESKKELERKNKIIEDRNKDIRDSINYASLIQNSILPPKTLLDENLKEYFIFNQPKDIVSGDFYWFSKLHTSTTGEEVLVISAVDCTGHGVPGALMSIVGSTLLNQSATEINVNSPADALRFLNQQLANTMREINDGMDVALCAINLESMTLHFAGAMNPLYIIRNHQLIELKGDRNPIGGKQQNRDFIFTNNLFNLEIGDCIYLFTDGYADQFGGEKGKKMKYKKFQETLLFSSNLTMEQQKDALKQHFESWKGKQEQVDDVLVIGIRIDPSMTV